MTFILAAAALSGLTAAHRNQPRSRAHSEVLGRCSCGNPVGSGLCYDGFNREPCCLLWATECPATSPYMKYSLDKACDYRPHQHGLFHTYGLEQKCQQVECLSVFNAFENSRLLPSRDKSRQEKPFNLNLVTGKSNKGKWFTKCACGQFNEASQQCQVKGKSKEGPCCSNLDDCATSDEWPVLYRNKAAAAEAAAEAATSRKMFVQSQFAAMQSLYGECLDNCKLRYRQLCLEDLQETEAAFVSKTNELRANRPGDYDRAYLEYANSLDKMEEKEKQERIVRNFQKSQKAPVELVDVSAWDGKNQSPESCCKCQKAMPGIGAAKVTSFCTSSTCPADCPQAWSGFCGNSPKTCESE